MVNCFDNSRNNARDRWSLVQLPNGYTSEVTLFVMQQHVPQRYVTPTTTTELPEALPAMTQEVLSRNRLLHLVEQFDVFPNQRHHLAPEEIEAFVHQYLTIEPTHPDLVRKRRMPSKFPLPPVTGFANNQTLCREAHQAVSTA